MLEWMMRFIGPLLGVVHQGISYLVPFRKIEARSEPLWDIIGFVAATGFGALIVVGLDEPVYDLLARSGWLDVLRREVWVWSWWVLVPVNIVLSDLLVYWSHRLLHSRRLWATHAWHHSPRYLYWLSGMRGSFVHMLFIMAPYSIVFLFFPTPEFGLIALALTIFYKVNQHYLHSNIWLPFQQQLELVFVTPRFHFVHHSSTRVRTNSNYGFVFSVWDRLFGTYTDPDSVPLDDALGLDYQVSNLHMLIGLPPGSRSADESLGVPSSVAEAVEPDQISETGAS